MFSDADPMSRKKMFLSRFIDICIWHPLLIRQEKIKRNSVLMRDKKKEVQEKIQRPIVFFLLSIYLVEVPESDSIISFDQRCVTKSKKKLFFKIKFKLPADNNNVISCLGYRHDNLLQYLNRSAIAVFRSYLV